MKLENKNLNESQKPQLNGSPIKHQLEYSIYSCKVSWCQICHKHFYNERNEIHTTIVTSEHYHIFEIP